MERQQHAKGNEEKSPGKPEVGRFVHPATSLNRRRVPHRDSEPEEASTTIAFALLKMQLTVNSLAASLALLAPSVHALLRFSCSQLVVERLDPLVFPGVTGSPHVHQIIGGNAFNQSMEYPRMDIPSEATCTTCTFAEDLSNYWTAVLYFRARNGTYKRVPQMANSGFEGANGGMTVYYTPSYNNDKVTAFKPVSKTSA